MSEQRGLRNPDTHGTTSDGEPYCESCGVCDEGWRCRCCLAAEVEALRARVQRVRELHKPVPGFNGHQWCDAQCEATCDGDATEWPCATIRALDGDALEGRSDD